MKTTTRSFKVKYANGVTETYITDAADAAAVANEKFGQTLDQIKEFGASIELLGEFEATPEADAEGDLKPSEEAEILELQTKELGQIAEVQSGPDPLTAEQADTQTQAQTDQAAVQQELTDEEKARVAQIEAQAQQEKQLADAAAVGSATQSQAVNGEDPRTPEEQAEGEALGEQVRAEATSTKGDKTSKGSKGK